MSLIKRKINTPSWVTGRTVYEVNLRQYSPGGTIREFEAHLPRLKELGVGILWFMPVFPVGRKNRKGSLGSYYSIRDYRKINPEFGTLEEFKSLIDKAHGMGLKVILDWVANHTAWDHHWTKDHPEFYHRDENGGFKAPVPEWEDVIHLDYGNPDLWDAMIGEMKFWLQEADVDGFRCDMAHLVPTLFWNRARRDLDRVKAVYMLAESENHDLLEYAFDTIYNWKLLHAMNETAAGKMNAQELMTLAASEVTFLPQGASQLNFTSNHDENSWQGSAIERMHYFLEPLTVLTFLLPGIPLIYSGQEAGIYNRLEFFDKDEINWKEDKMSSLLSILTGLRSKFIHDTAELSLLHVDNSLQKLIASFEIYDRGRRVITFLNLSNEICSFHFKDIEIEGKWVNVFNHEEATVNFHDTIILNPFGYQVLVKTV